jgi:hypothetical protein
MASACASSVLSLAWICSSVALRLPRTVDNYPQHATGVVAEASGITDTPNDFARDPTSNKNRTEQNKIDHEPPYSFAHFP